MENNKKQIKRLSDLLLNEDNKEQETGIPIINCNYYEPHLKLCSHPENETHRCTGVCINYDDC